MAGSSDGVWPLPLKIASIIIKKKTNKKIYFLFQNPGNSYFYDKKRGQHHLLSDLGCVPCADSAEFL